VEDERRQCGWRVSWCSGSQAMALLCTGRQQTGRQALLTLDEVSRVVRARVFTCSGLVLGCLVLGAWCFFRGVASCGGVESEQSTCRDEGTWRLKAGRETCLGRDSRFRGRDVCATEEDVWRRRCMSEKQRKANSTLLPQVVHKSRRRLTRLFLSKVGVAVLAASPAGCSVKVPPSRLRRPLIGRALLP
jgi:hypothetical protein